MAGGQLRDRVVTVLGIIAWLVAAGITLHVHGKLNVDLRVYRDAARTLGSDRTYLEHFTRARLNFTYPPFALVALSPLRLGPTALVEGLWWAVSCGALVGIVLLLLSSLTGHRVGALWRVGLLAAGLSAFALEPVRNNLRDGQINLLLILAVVADVLVVGSKRKGLLVGLAAAVKLTPLIYLLFFLVHGDRRAAARGLALFVGLGAASFVVLPSDSARYWLHLAFDAKRVGTIAYAGNQSWNGLFHRSPFGGDHLGTGLWVLCEVVTLAAGVFATFGLQRAHRPLEALLALALTELLVSPVSWTHHWSWVLLVPVVLAGRFRRDLKGCRALLVVLAVAVIGPYWWVVHTGWFRVLAQDSLVGSGAVLLGSLAWSARLGVGATPPEAPLPPPWTEALLGRPSARGGGSDPRRENAPVNGS